VRPEFATTEKAADLFGKLGPKIWLMMASKYELAKVAAVCAKHGLGFPDAPEFAQLAAATAAAVKL
jgi:hypothetical protein